VLHRAVGEAGEALILIDTLFTVGDTPCSGSIFLVPAAASLELLLAGAARR